MLPFTKQYTFLEDVEQNSKLSWQSHQNQAYNHLLKEHRINTSEKYS